MLANRNGVASLDPAKNEGKRKLISISPFQIFLPPQFVDSVEALDRRLSPHNHAACVEAAMRRNSRPIGFDLREYR